MFKNVDLGFATFICLIIGSLALIFIGVAGAMGIYPAMAMLGILLFVSTIVAAFND